MANSAKRYSRTIAPVRQHPVLVRSLIEMKIKITVNDIQRTVESGTTVSQLLGELGLEQRPVAVEKNLEIVSRNGLDKCLIEDGDRLEIVTLVGGG